MEKRREKFDLSLVINPLILWLIAFAVVNKTAQGLHIIESNFWSEVWNKFVDKCGDDEESFIVYTTTLYSIGLYWMFGTIFLLFNFIPSLKKFRHQEEKPIDVRKMFHALLFVVFNITFVSFSLSWLLFQLSRLINIPTDIRTVQNPLEVIAHVFISHTIIQEILVYYVHRALHLKLIYKYVHKQHHEYTSPLSLLAAYANPIEHVFSTMLPSIVGPIILGSPVSTIWIYIAFVTFIGASDHSGFKFPLLKDSTIHDMHHQTFLYNFAGTGWIDYLHQTLYLEKFDGKTK